MKKKGKSMKNIEKDICGSAWTSTEVIKNHRKLCLEYNGRFSGSQDARNAAEFIMEALRGYGVARVEQEWFPMTIWTRGSLRFAMTAPKAREFNALALPYSPAEDSVFDLVDLNMGHARDIQRVGDKIIGSAVLVDDMNPPDGPQLHRLQKYLLAREAGAAAFLFVQNQPGGLAPTGSLAFNHDLAPDQALPSVGLAMETARELRAWNRQTPVKLHIAMENTLQKGRDCNVVADLTPMDPQRETIIVCGHYDGHDIAQGALDNASGTAVIMEIARLLAPYSETMPCNIRLILFGSEELGLVGSHYHVRKHAEQLKGIRFVFNLDCVGNSGPLVLMLQHAPELEDTFKKWAAELPSDMHVANHIVPFSDHFPFMLHGIPSAFCVTPGSGGRGWGHTIADTFEKVPGEVLCRVSMFLARLIRKTARASDWNGKHKSRESVTNLLAPYQLRDLLKYEGHDIP